jgi:hypothetical protein
MANRTFLLSNDSPGRPAEGDRNEILCAASYMIPVFWYMLFDRASVINVEVDAEDGRKVEYPYLSKPGADAISLVNSRWNAVKRAIGHEHDALFQTWLSYVTPKSQGYLQCETGELWMMFDDTPTFLRHVELCMSAFSEALPIGQSAAWQELLGQANAWDGAKLSPADTFSFCGYAWVAEVPWE